MNRLLLPFLWLSAALWSGCLFDTDSPRTAGGGSSETTNGVILGYVRTPEGAPARSTRVILRPRNFLKDPGAPKTTLKLAEGITDSSGRFAIDSVDAGDYYLEASDSGRNAVLFEFSTGDRDTMVLETRSLKPTGAIIGTIASGPAPASGAFVQIYGLDRVARVNPAGAFSFNDLPEGRYTLRAALASSLNDPRELAGVTAQGADTTDVGTIPLAASFADEDYAAWAHSRRIVINTTASGANVPKDISDFPLLIRLNRGNFDFSQASGADVRFTDRYGKRLRYQVQRWDSAGQEAEVWVKVDTVHGLSRADFLTLHWGRPGAPDWSDSRQVFDTASAFGGVWHLGEEASGILVDGLYRDATSADQHGDDRIVSRDTAGLVGRGNGFLERDHIRIRPSAALRPTSYVYLSAWFRGTRTDSLGGSIAGLGDSYGLRVEKDGNVRMFVYGGPGKGWPLAVSTGVNVLDSSWHHIAGLYSSGYLSVFVDGVEKAKVAAAVQIPYILGTDFYIGRHGNNKESYDFIGQLDEVTVVNRLRGPNFAKLCFESQRLNPTLLEFQP